MGLFDKNDKGLFGGLFDFNGDGKTTWDEEFLAFKIFEEFTKEQEDSDDDFDSDLFDDTDNSDKYEWRIFCEDGTEYGLDPLDMTRIRKNSRSMKATRRFIHTAVYFCRFHHARTPSEQKTVHYRLSIRL